VYILPDIVTLGAIANGAAFPLLGYFLSSMISAFFNPDSSDMREEASFW
jgi:hypothetical protein